MNHLINIITPFKSNKVDLLDKTIKTLAYQNINDINHIIVCDKGSKSLVDSYFEEIQSGFSKIYNFVLVEVNKKGIYHALNVGLNKLKNDSLYLVLGAGDIIYLNKKYIFNLNNDIFIIPYIKTDFPVKIFTKIRNIYSGIPYCHNAIIFKKNDIRYSNKFKISADYLYFIEYVRNKEFIGEFKIELVNSFKVLVETEYGISSTKRLLKNFENLQIIYYYFSIKGIIFYLSFAFLRIGNHIFNKLKYKYKYKFKGR